MGVSSQPSYQSLGQPPRLPFKFKHLRLPAKGQIAKVSAILSSSGQREILRAANNFPAAALTTQRDATTEFSDVAIVHQMVEDHWRAFLLLGRQNPAAGASLIQSFDERISGYSASLSQDKAKVFLTTIEREREKLFLEYELNPDALKARLNIAVEAPQTRQARSRGQSFGEIVVRTAVRATVWEIVRSIFRR